MYVKTLIDSSIWIRFCLIIAVLVLLQGCAHAPASEVTVPRITKEKMMSMLGNPEVIVLDVRTAQDWENTEWKIKGAIREDRNDESGAWMDKYPKDKTLILYCA